MDNFDDLAKLRERLLNLQETFSSETGEVDYDDILKEMDIDLEQIEKDITEGGTKLDLPYQILHPDAIHPKYNYDSDSGFDLHSVEDVVIPAFGRALVPTGLKVSFEEGYEIQVRPKSGLAIKQGLTVLNTPGTVDQGYTGEIQVIVFNTNNYTVVIPKGMKVGQAVLCPVINGKYVRFEQVDTLNKKDRGNNGFGSTGI